MKKLRALALLSLFVFFSCNQENQKATKTESKVDSPEAAKNLKVSEDVKVVATETTSGPEAVKITELSNDELEIQALIRKVLNWSDSETAINLLPALTDSKGYAYTGFDIVEHKKNLQSLKKTDLFSKEFIENYDKIILTLNRKLKNKEFDEWLVGDLPTFNFMNDSNPWCLCQDVPYDKPNPWGFVEVEADKLKDNNGKLIWRWGKLELNNSPDWKEFKYRFEVMKEEGKWKVSYMEGFDFEESVK